MHEAFWNGLFDARWEGAPLGPEAIRLVRGLDDRGYSERTRQEYGHAAMHLGRLPARGGGTRRPGSRRSGCRRLRSSTPAGLLLLPRPAMRCA